MTDTLPSSQVSPALMSLPSGVGDVAFVGDTLYATTSSNARALPADELARRAAPFFPRVEAVADPAEALARAREAAGPEGAVLLAGSHYVLADLSSRA